MRRGQPSRLPGEPGRPGQLGGTRLAFTTGILPVRKSCFTTKTAKALLVVTWPGFNAVVAATTLSRAAAADAGRTRAAAAAFTTLPLMIYFLLQRQFSRSALAAAGSTR
jgi:hypothetical protein